MFRHNGSASVGGSPKSTGKIVVHIAQKKPANWVRGTVLLVAALAVFFLCRNIILTLFLDRGMYFFDGGWFAYITWRNDLLLSSPEIHPWGKISYLRQHLALWFWPLNGLSYLLDTDHIRYFAGWIGAIHVFGLITGYAAARVAFRKLGWDGWPALLGALVIGFLFAFNGIALAALAYPHFEIIIPFAICALLTALVAGRFTTALALLLLTLSLRTDAGFHLALFCGAWAAAKAIALRDLRDRAVLIPLGFAAAGFLYSVTGYAVQAVVLAGGNQFSNIYLGKIPFAHLTADLILSRLRELLFARTFAFVGFAGCLIAWALSRRLIFLAGIAAVMPWFLINLPAYSDAAGTFLLYYPFPFAVLLLWPLIFIHEAPEKIRPMILAVGIVALTASLALSSISSQNGSIWRYALLRKPTAEWAETSRVLDALADRLQMDKTLVDSASASIVGHRLDRHSFFGSKRPRLTDTVIYFASFQSAPAILESIRNWPSPMMCSHARTNVRVASINSANIRTAEEIGFQCSAWSAPAQPVDQGKPVQDLDDE